MKTIYFKIAVLIIAAVFTISCSKDEISSTTQTGGSSTTTSDTWVKLTAITSDGVVKPNYVIMMFEQPVKPLYALPPIKLQIVTDANGMAFFDLNAMVTSLSPVAYYFEAFVQNGSDLLWESITHPSYVISKGQMRTSSIIVK